jgi:hypothetical protein
MGIAPSKDTFKSLEGYARKHKEERRKILEKAGIEINEHNRKIAMFLQMDEVAGGFI